MRFLVDANLPRSLADVARTAGDEAIHVRDVGLGDATDETIAAYARAHDLLLVTRDLDFADVRAYPPAGGPGIVVLRLPEDAVASAIVALFGRLLAQRKIVERLSGRLAVVERDRVRVRPSLE